MAQSSNVSTAAESFGLAHSRNARQCDEEARKELDLGLADSAISSYFRFIYYYIRALDANLEDDSRRTLLSSAQDNVCHAEILIGWIKLCKDKQKNSIAGNDASESGKEAKKEKKKKSRKGNDDDYLKGLKEMLASTVITEEPVVTWDDVCGLGKAKETLKETAILPHKFPLLFVGNRKPWKGILLFGPPGTGKTYLAKAVAKEVDAAFFSVSSSTLVSKWQGESEKLIKELFCMARDAGKAVIFIDEVDSLARNRTSLRYSDSESSRRILAELLIQLDGMLESTGLLFLAATNAPWDLDTAFLRRMERRVYIPMPEEHDRLHMLKLHIGSTPHTLSDPDFLEIARATTGYSGADIDILVRDAIMQPVRVLSKAVFFKPIMVNEWEEEEEPLLTPCPIDDKDALPISLMSIKPERLHLPDVCRGDFEDALRRSSPSVGAEVLAKYVAFTKQRGQSGAATTQMLRSKHSEQPKDYMEQSVFIPQSNSMLAYSCLFGIGLFFVGLHKLCASVTLGR